MSGIALEWRRQVLHRCAGPIDQRVLEEICFAHRGERVRVNISDLARRCQLSRNGVKAALRRLQDEHLIWRYRGWVVLLLAEESYPQAGHGAIKSGGHPATIPGGPVVTPRPVGGHGVTENRSADDHLLKKEEKQAREGECEDRKPPLSRRLELVRELGLSVRVAG